MKSLRKLFSLFCLGIGLNHLACEGNKNLITERTCIETAKNLTEELTKSRNETRALQRELITITELSKTAGDFYSEEAASREQAFEEGIRCSAPDRCEFNRNLLDNLSAVFPTTRLIPVIQDRKSIGLKIFSVYLHSWITKLGLRDGDIIKTINNISISSFSPDKFLEVYAELLNAPRMSIVIDRNGKTINLEWIIR